LGVGFKFKQNINIVVSKKCRTATSLIFSFKMTQTNVVRPGKLEQGASS
jgi:hypothetical protein